MYNFCVIIHFNVLNCDFNGDLSGDIRAIIFDNFFFGLTLFNWASNSFKLKFFGWLIYFVLYT